MVKRVTNAQKIYIQNKVSPQSMILKELCSGRRGADACGHRRHCRSPDLSSIAEGGTHPQTPLPSAPRPVSPLFKNLGSTPVDGMMISKWSWPPVTAIVLPVWRHDDINVVMTTAHRNHLTSLHSGRHLECRLLAQLHWQLELGPPLVLSRPTILHLRTLLPTNISKMWIYIAHTI